MADQSISEYVQQQLAPLAVVTPGIQGLTYRGIEGDAFSELMAYRQQVQDEKKYQYEDDSGAIVTNPNSPFLSKPGSVSAIPTEAINNAVQGGNSILNNLSKSQQAESGSLATDSQNMAVDKFFGNSPVAKYLAGATNFVSFMKNAPQQAPAEGTKSTAVDPTADPNFKYSLGNYDGLLNIVKDSLISPLSAQWDNEGAGGGLNLYPILTNKLLDKYLDKEVDTKDSKLQGGVTLGQAKGGITKLQVDILNKSSQAGADMNAWSKAGLISPQIAGKLNNSFLKADSDRQGGGSGNFGFYVNNNTVSLQEFISALSGSGQISLPKK